AGRQGDVRDVTSRGGPGEVEERYRLLVDLDVEVDATPSNGVADRRRSEGLPDALDPDRRHGLLLAQGLRIGLVIGHPTNLDEEVLVVRVGALLRERRREAAVDVDLGAQFEVHRAVAVEVNASAARVATVIRLPAVGKPVTVRVFDDTA